MLKQIARMYRFLAHHVGHARSVIASICALSLVDQAFSIGCVYVWKDIIDQYLIKARGLTPGQFFPGMIGLVVLWQGMSFVSRLAKNRQFYQTKVLADQVSLAFLERAYAHLIGLSLDFHEARSTGQVMRQLSRAREDLNRIILAFFDKLVMQIISFVIVTGFFFYICWEVALVMLVYIPIFLYFTRHQGRLIDQTQKEINNEGERAYASVQQALDAFMLVQSFQTQKLETERLAANHRLSHAGLQRKTEAFQKLAFIQGTLVNLVRLSIIASGGYFVYVERITVGEVVLLSMWGYFIYNPMYQFSDLLALFAEGMDSVARVEQLLTLQASIANPPNGHAPAQVRGEIVFRDVSFAYPVPGARPLGPVDFVLRPGQKLALVGPSGSGKSTLAKLLPRFYDVAGGAILLDGVDVRNWDLGHLRAAVGMVLQDAVLFNDSIYNNILYGNAGATRQQVEAAARKAFAHDFVMALPQGYDTLVGERGVKLSGGEKQRLAIARTILRDPPVLILDEATSALDSESEVMVLRALEHICANHTTLTIAHRLSTIRHCDHILFCEEGRIVEQGDHDSLMAQGGRYATFVHLQRKKEHYEPGPDADGDVVLGLP